MKKFGNILWLITKGTIKLVIAWNIICALVARTAILIDVKDRLRCSLHDAAIKLQYFSLETLYNYIKKSML